MGASFRTTNGNSSTACTFKTPTGSTVTGSAGSPVGQVVTGNATLLDTERSANRAMLMTVKELDRRLARAAAPVEDADLLERCYGSADFREGVTAFLDHRKPRWEGR